jgi:hypothetical protein
VGVENTYTLILMLVCTIADLDNSGEIRNTHPQQYHPQTLFF